MIREFVVEDIDLIIEITRKELNTFERNSLIDIQEKAKVFIVWEDGEIKGFAYAIELNKDKRQWSIQVYVDSHERRKGIGSVLHHEVEKRIQDERPSVIVSEASSVTGDSSSFYFNLGYKKWYGSSKMHYSKGPQPAIDMEFIDYEDKYYEQFTKCRQDCFYEIRRSNDIQPYITPLSEEDRKAFLSEQKYTYLTFDNENLIGAITIKDNYLDRIMVSPLYQGKGYGRKITQFGINQVIKAGENPIFLYCVEGNQAAESLYKSLGFEIVEVTYVYRKFLDNSGGK